MRYFWVNAAPARAPTDASGLPDKPYFKIGEAARLCAVKPYVLRYWETEFKSVRPAEDAVAAAPVPPRDVELLLKIRHLLYEKRFTIEGARARLREFGHDEGPRPHAAPLRARGQHARRYERSSRGSRI